MHDDQEAEITNIEKLMWSNLRRLINLLWF
jgi:hypothetical protein